MYFCSETEAHTVPRVYGMDDIGMGKLLSPLQYSCLENPMDRGAWQATGHGVTKSQTSAALAARSVLPSNRPATPLFSPACWVCGLRIAVASLVEHALGIEDRESEPCQVSERRGRTQAASPGALGPDWASPELSPSVESCGCCLGPSPVRLG